MHPIKTKVTNTHTVKDIMHNCFQRMSMQDVMHTLENSSVALQVILKLGSTSDPVLDER
jgi:hypothetical protein